MDMRGVVFLMILFHQQMQLVYREDRASAVQPDPPSVLLTERLLSLPPQGESPAGREKRRKPYQPPFCSCKKGVAGK